MAVIRQTRRFSQRNIGVVRGDTGSSLVRQSVANLANNLIETSFNDLKKAAVKEGKNVADSAAIEQLRSIDPKTGKPQAFVAPEGFGSAAREAYDQVIQQRFVNTLESDFKLKAAELAVQFENDPDGVENFEEAFSSYVDGFGDSKNIDPSINNMIQTLGSQLLASNKINLTQQRMVRQRADTKSGFNADMLTDIDQYSSMVEMGANDSVVFREKMESYIQNGLDSNLINKEEARAYRRSMAMAEATGLSRQLGGLISDDKDITHIQVDNIFSAIKYPKKSLESLPESVRPLIEKIREVGKSSNITFDEIADSISPDLQTIRSDITSKLSEDRYYANQKERTKAEGEALDKALALEGLPDIRANAAEKLSAAIAANDFDAVNEVMSKFESDLKKAGDAKVAQGTLNKARQNMREVYQQAIITEMGFLGEDGSATSIEEMVAIRQYFLSRGEQTKGMSKEAIALAEKIKDHYVEFDDSDNFYAELSRMERNSADLNQISAADRRTAINQNEITSGAGMTSNSQHRETMEESLNPDGDVNFWFNEGFVGENERLRREIIQKNVIPQGAVNVVKLISEGDLSDENLIKAAQTYASFAEAGTKRGDFRNMWAESGVLSEETIGTLEGMIRFASLHPDGIASLPAVRAKFIDIKNDPKLYASRRREVLGSDDDKELTEKDFVREILGDDVGELVLRDLAPMVKGFITFNANKQQLEDTLKKVYKNQYKPTDGYVIDPVYGSDVNSRHSLQALFPDDKSRSLAVRFINEQLSEFTEARLKPNRGAFDFREEGEIRVTEGGVRTRVMTESEDDYETNRVFLAPLPMSGGGASNVRFMVMQKLPSGGFTPLIENGSFFGFETDEVREAVHSQLLASTDLKPEALARREEQRKAGTLFPEGLNLFGLVDIPASELTGDN